jgi:hypothetical protein
MNTVNPFIVQPHQLDPYGQNYDYLSPQYKFFYNTTNIAQHQPTHKPDFKNDFQKVKYNYAFQKALTQDNTYPTKTNYKFYDTNRDEYVGGAFEDENLHARQMRLLRLQAENFENAEANKLEDLTDTTPFTDTRGSFIQILQNLAEIRTNTQGESLSAVKPERLNDILTKTINNGIHFNQIQLNQLSQVLETIFNNSNTQRVFSNKSKFLTLLKIYAIVIQLLSTLNTQDEDIRKRKLDAFTDDILDKTATVIAEDLLQNYKALVGLASTDLLNDAKMIDKSANPAGRPKADDKEEKDDKKKLTKRDKKAKPTKEDKGAKATTSDDTQLKNELESGDPETWKTTSNKEIKKLFSRNELFRLAVRFNLLEDTATEKQKNKKGELIRLLKQHFEEIEDNDEPETKQQEADDDEDDEVESGTDDDGEDETGGGFTPNRRSLLRLLK